MSHIHLAGAILQTTQVQRQQAAEKNQRLHRQQELARDVALEDDQLEHQIDDAKDTAAARKTGSRDPRQSGKHRPLDDGDARAPHIDLTA